MARLDRDPPEGDSGYANTGSIPDKDRPLLETVTGRAQSAATGPEASIEAEEINEKSVGTRPSGERTEFHLSGTGGVETDDGLDEISEMVREAAEDIPDDEPSDAQLDRPVFDRGENIRR
jgi:hypothetical protein